MKKLLIITTLFTCLNATAQKVYNDLKGFDKVELSNINGSVDIQLGQEFSIKIDGLNTNDTLVKVYIMPEYKLMISMPKGLSWDMVQKMNLKIKITMPEISKLYNSSNADVTIKNFVGRYLGIENNGNGNVELLGRMIDSLDIENNGNGNTNAKKIIAKKTKIIKNGNGDVLIKTNDNFEASLSGNGDIVNYGTGKAIILKQSGNGQVIYRN